MIKNMPAMWETWVWSLGWEDPLEKRMITDSSILAWKIPWTEEPGGLESMGSQRVSHDLVTNTETQAFFHDYVILLLMISHCLNCCLFSSITLCADTKDTLRVFSWCSLWKGSMVRVQVKVPSLARREVVNNHPRSGSVNDGSPSPRAWEAEAPKGAKVDSPRTGTWTFSLLLLPPDWLLQWSVPCLGTLYAAIHWVQSRAEKGRQWNVGGDKPELTSIGTKYPTIK